MFANGSVRCHLNGGECSHWYSRNITRLTGHRMLRRLENCNGHSRPDGMWLSVIHSPTLWWIKKTKTHNRRRRLDRLTWNWSVVSWKKLWKRSDCHWTTIDGYSSSVDDHHGSVEPANCSHVDDRFHFIRFDADIARHSDSEIGQWPKWTHDDRSDQQQQQQQHQGKTHQREDSSQVFDCATNLGLSWTFFHIQSGPNRSCDRTAVSWLHTTIVVLGPLQQRRDFWLPVSIQTFIPQCLHSRCGRKAVIRADRLWCWSARISTLIRNGRGQVVRVSTMRNLDGQLWKCIHWSWLYVMLEYFTLLLCRFVVLLLCCTVSPYSLPPPHT